MRWNYDSSYKDMFGMRGGVHTDILIVPHASNVTKVSGKPPVVTSKVPQFTGTQWNDDGSLKKKGKAIPGKYAALDYIITNENIIKEKFEYTRSLNSSDNLTFSSAEAASVRFTIRNEKEYIPDPDKTDEPEKNIYYGVWMPVIPNLQKLQIYDKDRTNNDKKVLVGEIESRALFKLYMYFNGDSDTLIYMGMFMVEEDKVSSDGYERQITAYDFMLFLRDMDVINWYKRLFHGTTKEKGDTRPPLKPRAKNGKITIKEALEDFFKEISFTTGVQTNTGPSNWEQDIPDDQYPGPGLPIELDTDLFDKNATYQIPGTKVINGETIEVERYGYLPISELYFYEDEKIVKQDSLSFGKFLEDIGILAGRYPMIRTDYIIDGDYNYEEDLATTYEHCVLTFKPLPKYNVSVNSENTFDNSVIAKGFQHDYYTVESVYIIEVWGYKDKEKPMVSYRNLTKDQAAKRKALMKTEDNLKTLRIENNIFTSYLDKTKKEHKKILKALFGTETGKDPYYNSGLFKYAHDNIKYRTYVPYEVTTSANPCRDPGDRIRIAYQDPITGEFFSCETYILELKISGIQNMMSTYTAKGDKSNATFSDYKTGTKYSSSTFSNQLIAFGAGGGDGDGSTLSAGDGTVTISGMSANDFVEIIRNIGYRFLEEPTNVTAKYIEGDDYPYYTFHKYYVEPSIYEHGYTECLTELSDNSTTTTLTLIDSNEEEVEYEVTDMTTVKAIESGTDQYCLFVFDPEDGKWHKNKNYDQNELELYQVDYGKECVYYDEYFNYDKRYNYSTILPGDKTKKIKCMKVQWDYDYEQETGQSDTHEVTLNGFEYGDIIRFSNSSGDGDYTEESSMTYLYPGFWYGVHISDDKYWYEESAYCDPIYNYGTITEYDSGGHYNVDDNENHVGVFHSKVPVVDGSKQNPIIGVFDVEGVTKEFSYYVRSYQRFVEYNNKTINNDGLYEEYFIYGKDKVWHKHTSTCIGDVSNDDKLDYYAFKQAYYNNKIIINDEEVEAQYGDYVIVWYDNDETNDKVIWTWVYPGFWFNFSYPAEDPIIYKNVSLYSSPFNVPLLNDGSNTGSHGDVNLYGTYMDRRRVEITYTDPENITVEEPVTIEWKGTLIVRKEDAAPLNPWDGEIISDCTVKNYYKDYPFIDYMIDINKTYYYGIFPYGRRRYQYSSNGRQFGYYYDGQYTYRFTKVIRVNTDLNSSVPEITNIKAGGITDDWDGSEVAIIYSGNNNKLTVQVSNSHILFKLYSGSSVIYSWNSLVGSTPSDADKIRVSFLEDNTLHVAKPSFVYETGNDRYSYNQESPSKSEMQAIYNWLHP